MTLESFRALGGRSDKRSSLRLGRLAAWSDLERRMWTSNYGHLWTEVVGLTRASVTAWLSGLFAGLTSWLVLHPFRAGQNPQCLEMHFGGKIFYNELRLIVFQDEER